MSGCVRRRGFRGLVWEQGMAMRPNFVGRLGCSSVSNRGWSRSSVSPQWRL